MHNVACNISGMDTQCNFEVAPHDIACDVACDVVSCVFIVCPDLKVRSGRSTTCLLSCTCHPVGKVDTARHGIRGGLAIVKTTLELTVASCTDILRARDTL